MHVIYTLEYAYADLLTYEMGVRRDGGMLLKSSVHRFAENNRVTIDRLLLSL